MKNLLILLFLIQAKIGFSQSQVDFFCSGRTYQIIAEKAKDQKQNVKIIGYNMQKMVIDSTKESWDKLTQEKKDSITILKLKSKSILISQDAIIENTKFDEPTKSTTIEFFDTLLYSGLSEIKTTTFANELATTFKNRFPVTDCKFDFNLLLERLELKTVAAAAKDNQTETKSIVDVLENSFGIAIGLGPNWNRQTTYDYYVSPYDTTLRRDKLNSTSFVASLLLTWNPLFNYKRFKDGDSTIATGESFRAPGKFGIAIGFNFAEVSSSTNLQYNFRLSGGIGILGNLGGGFQIGLFHDWTQQKVLRTDMESYIGKKYPFADLTNLDSRLFTTQFIPSISFKCIYKFKASTGERRGLLNP